MYYALIDLTLQVPITTTLDQQNRALEAATVTLRYSTERNVRSLMTTTTPDDSLKYFFLVVFREYKT